MLVSPQLVHSGFRVLCGLSPHMYESCWYDTNIPNLWNYLKNRLNNLVDKEADVQRTIAEAAQTADTTAVFASDIAEAHKVEAK